MVRSASTVSTAVRTCASASRRVACPAVTRSVTAGRCASIASASWGRDARVVKDVQDWAPIPGLNGQIWQIKASRKLVPVHPLTLRAPLKPPRSPPPRLQMRPPQWGNLLLVPSQLLRLGPYPMLESRKLSWQPLSAWVRSCTRFCSRHYTLTRAIICWRVLLPPFEKGDCCDFTPVGKFFEIILL